MQQQRRPQPSTKDVSGEHSAKALTTGRLLTRIGRVLSMRRKQNLPQAENCTGIYLPYVLLATVKLREEGATVFQKFDLVPKPCSSPLLLAILCTSSSNQPAVKGGSSRSQDVLAGQAEMSQTKQFMPASPAVAAPVAPVAPAASSAPATTSPSATAIATAITLLDSNRNSRSKNVSNNNDSS